MKNGFYVIFEYNDYKVIYLFVEVKGLNKILFILKDILVDYKIDSNEIVYLDVFLNIDFQIFIFNENIKEDLVFYQYDGYNIFIFQVKIDLQVKE